MTLPEETKSPKVWGRFASYVILIFSMGVAFAFFAFQLAQMLFPRIRM